MSASELHFSVSDLAHQWRFSPKTIRRQLREMLGAALPGVLQIGNDERRTKRKHVTVSIPESIANDLYAFMTTYVRERTTLRERRRRELVVGLAPT